MISSFNDSERHVEEAMMMIPCTCIAQSSCCSWGRTLGLCCNDKDHTWAYPTSHWDTADRLCVPEGQQGQANRASLMKSNAYIKKSQSRGCNCTSWMTLTDSHSIVRSDSHCTHRRSREKSSVFCGRSNGSHKGSAGRHPGIHVHSNLVHVTPDEVRPRVNITPTTHLPPQWIPKTSVDP